MVYLLTYTTKCDILANVFGNKAILCRVPCKIKNSVRRESKTESIIITGFQKLTLLDFPGTVACTVFTHGCNFRCPFCHNASLVCTPAQNISAEEFLQFLKSRQGILEGVAVTGGEPTLHRGLPGFLANIKDLGYKVKLDTNGTNPDMVKELCNSGLTDRIAMDIKDAPELYGNSVGTTGYDIAKITETKDFLLGGSTDYEFRTTLVKGIHTKQSIKDAAKWIAGAKEYYLQQFINSGDLINAEGLGGFSKEEMGEFLSEVLPIIPTAK